MSSSPIQAPDYWPPQAPGIESFIWDGSSVRDIERQLDPSECYCPHDVQRFQGTVPPECRGELIYVQDDNPTNSIEVLKHHFMIAAVDASNQALIMRMVINTYLDAEGSSCSIVPLERALLEHKEFMLRPLKSKISGMLEFLESDLRDFAENRGTPDVTCEFAGHLFFLAGPDQQLACSLTKPGSQVTWAREVLSSADGATLETLAGALTPKSVAPEDVNFYVGALPPPMAEWLRDAVDEFNADYSPAPRM